jgi:hypothetical protein
LRNSLNGEFAEKVMTLNEITAVLVGEKGIKDQSNSFSSRLRQLRIPCLVYQKN